MGLHRRRRSTRLAVGVATLVVTGAGGAQASAAQISLDARCYLNTGRATASVTISGRGFFPSSAVDIGGGVFGSAKTDAAGTFMTKVKAPNATIRPGARAFKVSATDQDFATGAKVAATTTGHYTLGGVPFSGNYVGFGTRITYYFGGFRSGRQIYGHYFVGARETGRKRFGRATGPCGTLKTRATGYPVSRAHPDKWMVYFDDVKTFMKRAIPTYIYAFRKV